MTELNNDVVNNMFTVEEVTKLEKALTLVDNFRFDMYNEGLGFGEVNHSESRNHSYNDLENCCSEFMETVDKLLNKYGLGVLGNVRECKVVPVTDPEYVKQCEFKEHVDLHSKVSMLTLDLMAAEQALEKFEKEHNIGG